MREPAAAAALPATAARSSPATLPPIGLGAIAAVATACIAWAWATGIELQGVVRALVKFGLPTALGLALGFIQALRPHARSFYFLGLWLATGLLGSLLSFLAVGWGMPMQDAALARADAALGFYWPAWLAFVQSHRWLDVTLLVAYNTLIPQAVLALVLLGPHDHAERARELWWLGFAGVVVCCLISGLLPAVGAFGHYGVRLQLAPHLAEYVAMHAGQLRALGVPEPKGVVSFPSYHVVCAILLTYAYRGRRVLFPLFATLNGVMLVSVFTEGGHYLVDAIGGAAVALALVAASRLWKRRNAPQPEGQGAQSVRSKQQRPIPSSGPAVVPAPTARGSGS